jgi:hypothetical protein
MKVAIALLLTGCSLSDKTHCTTPADCLNGEACVAGTCEMPTTNIVGDWFGGLPDDTMLDNDGVHFDANGTWTRIKAIEPTTGPEANSRLDPDEQYCEPPETDTGDYTVTGDTLSGTPDDGTIVLLTDHELDLSDGSTTKPFFRIDPPRFASSCTL